MNDSYYELSYHQQKFKKKSRDVQKYSQKQSKMSKNLEKIEKNWYYVHFDTKISIKNQRFNVVNNKY